MKKFKWRVEFEIDETWVADGFNLTEDVAKEMIENYLGWAHPSETAAKIVSSPPEKDIFDCR